MKKVLSMTGLLGVLIVAMAWPAVAQVATQDITGVFTAPTVNASSVTGYIVQRKTGLTGTFAQVGPTLGPTVLTFTDVGVAQGTVFCYRELATGALSNSPPSPESCVGTAGVPGAPGAPALSVIIR